MKTYISKPVTIQAVQWTGENKSEIQELFGNTGDYFFSDTDSDLIIRTLEGNMKANISDWIIKGTEGEFYPCKDSVFKRKYVEV